GVKEALNAINGVTDQQISKVEERRKAWDEFSKSVSNAWFKTVAAVSSAMPHITGTGVIGKMIEEEEAEARSAANTQIDLQRDIQKQEMENARAGIEAFKQGTAEKLSQLRIYAAAARAYYGTDSAEEVVKANQQIISEERAVNEERARAAEALEHTKIQAAERGLQIRLQLINKEITEDDQYLTEQSKAMEELYGGWEQTYTEITAKHAAMLHQETAEAARSAKEEVKTWQGMVAEIGNAEGTLVSDLLSRRKSLS